MAKKKAPARKGGAKNAAPKKAPARKKPIPVLVAEKSVEERLERSKPGNAPLYDPADVAFQPQHPNVEEQFERDQLEQARALANMPATPPPGPKSKFWRQYQDSESGEFIGWRKALTLTKERVISRLRLRKQAG